MAIEFNRRKTPRQQRSRATVDAILDAAARILEREGTGAINTNYLAEAAGVSVGSLYQYFPNKEAILAALHERHAGEMHALIVAKLSEPKPSLADAISSVVNAVIQAHLIQPELHRALEAQESLLQKNDYQEPMHENIRANTQALLERHRDELTLTNIPLATYMLTNTVELLVHAAIIDRPKKFSVPQLERSIVELVLRYLTARAPHEKAHRTKKYVR